MSVELSTFSGKAYNENNEHIFTEEYLIKKDDNKILSVTTRFLSPQGSLIAEMSSDFPENAYLPKVSFMKKEHEFKYGTALIEKSIELFKTTPSQFFKRKTLHVKENMVAGHGFYFYILDKLEALLSGEKHQMTFVQPTRLNAYTFNMRAHKEIGSDHLVRVHLTADGRFLKAFVPKIELVIDRNTKTLISYEGLSGFLADDTSLKKISVHYSTPMVLEPMVLEPMVLEPMVLEPEDLTH